MCQKKGDRIKAKLCRAGSTAAILVACFWAGTFLRPQPASTADVRKGAPREHFLAGDERSIPILQEISGTLKQMDARLSRIEEVVAAAAKRDREG